MAREGWEKFRQKEPTQSAEVLIECYADKRMFSPEFSDMPKAMQKIFQGPGGISLPCQGSGAVGVWCNECMFGEVDEE